MDIIIIFIFIHLDDLSVQKDYNLFNLIMEDFLDQIS